MFSIASMQPAWPSGPNAFGPPTFSPSDESNLRLLSIFHYVYAGLLGLVMLFFSIYVILGVAMIAAPGSGGHGAVVGGGVILAFGLLVMGVIGAKVVVLIMAARSLVERTRHTLCVVAAVLSCLAMPLGTILGVFTLVMLFKPQVKAEFDRNTPLAS